VALQNDKNSALEILLLDPQLVRAGSGYAAPMDGHHRQSTPEPTIVGWAQHLRANATVLDVAAGGGRHALWLAARGHRVTAIDRDTTALRQATLAEPASANVCIVQADLENAPWPLPEELFDAVVVVNYLWRDLLPTLFASVAPGGHLLYETFAVGNERYGRPRNPDFLLRANELQDVTPPEFDVLEFAQGEVGDPPCAVRQRLLAQRTS
jgi:SAM-dependent methyltransferase